MGLADVIVQVSSASAKEREAYHLGSQAQADMVLAIVALRAAKSSVAAVQGDMTINAITDMIALLERAEESALQANTLIEDMKDMTERVRELGEEYMRGLLSS